eukprot:2933688-Lingulodinium_polyedra.AAC.1
MKVVARLRKLKGGRQSHANEYVKLRVARYWEAGQRLFRQAPEPLYSIALDGTRVSGKDMLFSA